MKSEHTPEGQQNELSQEALSVLKQTIKEIKNINALSNKSIDSSLLVMSSADIADALSGKIDSAQFTNPADLD